VHEERWLSSQRDNRTTNVFWVFSAGFPVRFLMLCHSISMHWFSYMFVAIADNSLQTILSVKLVWWFLPKKRSYPVKYEFCSQVYYAHLNALVWNYIFMFGIMQAEDLSWRSYREGKVKFICTESLLKLIKKLWCTDLLQLIIIQEPHRFQNSRSWLSIWLSKSLIIVLCICVVCLRNKYNLH
jgi:hypothetical protein